MEINLETDETIELMVNGSCNFRVWGERNEEGTMIIKWDRNEKCEVVTYDGACGKPAKYRVGSKGCETSCFVCEDCIHHYKEDDMDMNIVEINDASLGESEQ